MLLYNVDNNITALIGTTLCKAALDTNMKLSVEVLNIVHNYLKLQEPRVKAFWWNDLVTVFFTTAI